MVSDPDPVRTPLSIAVLFFDGVEELDAVGPWEVLTFWARLSDRHDITVTSVGLTAEPVTCSQGLRIAVDEVVTDRRYDILVSPGGPGARRLAMEDDHVELIRGIADQGTLIAAVCTGALSLARAGLLAGQRATTHKRSLDLLAEYDPTIEIDAEARFVDQGTTITSAGISAGIDMALHLVERMEDQATAAKVADMMQYDPYFDGRP
jgi:transcriptional regulator GlxA family with amidase domain